MHRRHSLLHVDVIVIIFGVVDIASIFGVDMAFPSIHFGVTILADLLTIQVIVTFILQRPRFVTSLSGIVHSGGGMGMTTIRDPEGPPDLKGSLSVLRIMYLCRSAH
jgi:hypothetical protein